jgi:hypothetical protein
VSEAEAEAECVGAVCQCSESFQYQLINPVLIGVNDLP